MGRSSLVHVLAGFAPWLLLAVAVALLAVAVALWLSIGRDLILAFRSGQRAPAARMEAEEVLALVHDAIVQRGATRHACLNVVQRPRDGNGGVWIVREATVGSWWLAEVEDRTGVLRRLLRQGVR